MAVRYIWKCPGCERQFLVPSVDDLTFCPDCQKSRELEFPVVRKTKRSKFEVLVTFFIYIVVATIAALFHDPSASIEQNLKESEPVVILSVLWIGCVIVYFFPTLTALGRNHRNVVAIFTLNATLGWTIFGWSMAMTWAVMADQECDK